MPQKLEYVSLKEHAGKYHEFEHQVEEVAVRLKDTDGRGTLVRIFAVGERLIVDVCGHGEELEVLPTQDEKYEPIMSGSVELRVRRTK